MRQRDTNQRNVNQNNQERNEIARIVQKEFASRGFANVQTSIEISGVGVGVEQSRGNITEI